MDQETGTSAPTIWRLFPGKRMLDLMLTVSTLPLILLVTGIIAIVVWFVHGGPVLFAQTRPGLYARPFTLYKFRTMTNARSADGQLLPDPDRLTSFGKLMRRTSLDELPELLNVLKGEMSLVGPRPLLMEYLTLYTPEQQGRHLVPPGLTGWAQVNGRNTANLQHRFLLDLWYVEHRSLWLDCKILLMTPGKVLKREGLMHPDDPSWEGFFKGVPPTKSATSTCADASRTDRHD
ncbi:MAG: sugar transferase [Nitrospirales bacterium]